MNWRESLKMAVLEGAYAKGAKAPSETESTTLLHLLHTFRPRTRNLTTCHEEIAVTGVESGQYQDPLVNLAPKQPQPTPATVQHPAGAPEAEQAVPEKTGTLEEVYAKGAKGPQEVEAPEAALALANSAAEAALDVIREHEVEAIDLLSREHGAEPLEASLKGRAVELWSKLAGERLFIVADEADAAKLGEPRGTIYTAAEVRKIVSIRNPEAVAEIHRWKRMFTGRLRECSLAEEGALGEGSSEVGFKVTEQPVETQHPVGDRSNRHQGLGPDKIRLCRIDAP